MTQHKSIDRGAVATMVLTGLRDVLASNDMELPPDLGEDGLKLFAPMIYSKLPRHPDTSADIGKIREILQGETQVESRMRIICRGC